MGTTDQMTYHEWVSYGMDMGWIGPRLCIIHDGYPATEEEDEMFDEGGDPCIPVFRVYDSIEEKESVERNHAPSVWRKL